MQGDISPSPVNVADLPNSTSIRRQMDVELIWWIPGSLTILPLGSGLWNNEEAITGSNAIFADPFMTHN
jgi:hypothetical protein